MKNETLIEIKGNARIQNLRNMGFVQSGANGGNTTSFKQYLSQIYGGNLIDERFLKNRSEEEKEIILNQISKLEEENISLEREIENILKNEIPSLNESVGTYEQKLKEYLNGSIDVKNISGTIEVFNLQKFLITSFFLLMLSIFIFLFYVAVVYKALFINPQDILLAIKAGNWGISILPHWNEVVIALNNNLMVLFAPFIFFGFGYVLHLILESAVKFKYLIAAAIVLITFLLDYLLADQIYKRLNQALEIIDSPKGDFKDIVIVIIMGFVVYLIWSIIFHFWMVELNKRNIPNRLRKFIKDLKLELKQKQKESENCKSKLDSNRIAITRHKKVLEHVLIPISVIINSLSEFSQGWMQFVNGSNDKTLLKDCEMALNEFLKSKDLENFKYDIEK